MGSCGVSECLDKAICLGLSNSNQYFLDVLVQKILFTLVSFMSDTELTHFILALNLTHGGVVSTVSLLAQNVVD